MAPDARYPGFRGVLATLAACVFAALPAGASGGALLCRSAHLTLLGADLVSGEILLGPSGGRDLVALDTGSASAVAMRAGRDGGIRGGSVAPGPVVATRPCGPECLAVVEWRDGGWGPLGEEILVDAASKLVETTRDRSGAPWVVLREAADAEGRVALTAYRQDGRDWKLEARARAGAVGNPLASPSPASELGIVVGDLEILAGASETRVLEDRPRAVELEGAQIHWLGDGRPLLITGDDDLYEWTGGSRSGWRPVRWRPAGERGRERPRVEVLPATGENGRRSLVWSTGDDPDADVGRLYLVEWNENGGWRDVIALDDGVRTPDGTRLPFRQVLRLADGRWFLLAGCVDGPEGVSLAYLLLDPEGAGGAVVAAIRVRE